MWLREGENMTITLSITESADQQLLQQSITGYRNANSDLDQAIEKENWIAIDHAQSNREMHACTIALIINKIAVKEGVYP